jgi:hypothetical protein
MLVRTEDFDRRNAVRIGSGPQHGRDWLGACRVKKNDTARAPTGGNGGGSDTARQMGAR